MPHVIVWDIETVPDLAGYAAANGHDGKTDDEVRAELGEKFPKHIYHSIICIGALIAHRDNDHWGVEALGAPHVGERSEKELIAAFVDRIAELIARPCINLLVKIFISPSEHLAGTTSESYVGVPRSLAAPLRFPHGPSCHGAWK